jgi:3-oxoacyl-[acyl-carrier-protein] synthase-3
MLEHLRKRAKIPPEKFVVSIADFGNTVSCTIPIALKSLEETGKLRRNQTLMLVGFGVGYSWGGMVFRTGESYRGLADRD